MLLKVVSGFSPGAIYLKLIPTNPEDEKELCELLKEGEIESKLTLARHSVDKEKILSLLVRL